MYGHNLTTCCICQWSWIWVLIVGMLVHSLLQSLLGLWRASGTGMCRRQTELVSCLFCLEQEECLAGVHVVFFDHKPEGSMCGGHIVALSEKGVEICVTLLVCSLA